MNQNQNSLGEVHGSVAVYEGQAKGKRILSFIGPAFLISVGYMDPGNWATDIAGGSSFGYTLLWVLLASNLLALLLQTLSARFGIVSGMDLAQASRAYYSKPVNICLYILAELSITACDLAEVIGMAIGLNLLFGLPLIWGVSIALLDTFLILFLMHKGMRIMEIFIGSMILIMGLSFLIELFMVRPDALQIAKGFVPFNLKGNALYIAIGIIGATVMPHNLYLHSSLVQTRKIKRSFKGIREALRFNLVDTGIALNLAFFVNAAILILASAAFHKNGFHEVAEIQDASNLLHRILGSWAPRLFAVALVASGQSSTVTGTLAGQIIMEGYLHFHMKPWLRRLLTRSLAIIPAIIAILYFGERSLGSLLLFSQVILSLQLGFAMIPLIHFTNSEVFMKTYKNSIYLKVMAFFAALIIIGLNIKLAAEQIHIWLTGSKNSLLLYGLLLPVLILLAAVLIYIIAEPVFERWRGPRSLRVLKKTMEGAGPVAEASEFP